MLSAILGRRYSPLAVGWMREASALPHLWATDDLCSFASPGGSQKSPRSADTIVRQRSEERRVGKECVSTCSSRCRPHHNKKYSTVHNGRPHMLRRVPTHNSIKND